MYQNAPPPHGYNQGYTPPQQQQQQFGGGGYYNDSGNMPPMHPNQGGGYGAPSPVNAAYQGANAAMAGAPQRGPSPLNAQGNNAGGGSAASGLIRLTLRKPMGIVFEPMTDPHNPSQQRGVRICDLPRTGAAAMSQKLEVGDELLSINDKTMSRLTFDEIMDFIIEADKERVDLLFRRPAKDKLKGGDGNTASAGAGGGQPMSPMGLGGIGSNSNSVKWIDEKSDMGGKLTENVPEPEKESKRSGSGGHRGDSGRSSKVRDEPSVDDTYNDGYTVESQSQYTMETYEDNRGGRGGKRGGRGGKSKSSKRDRRGRDRRDRESKRRHDPVESGGFLDLLIDTLCTSVMGRDARDMCGDGSEDGTGRTNDYDDEDDEFTVDDGTYATYEDRHERDRRRKMDDESLVTEDEQTFITEDDGTRTTRESQDVMSKQQRIKEHLRREKDRDLQAAADKSKDAIGDFPQDDANAFNDDPFHQQTTAPDPPTKAGGQSQQQMQQPADQQVSELESAMASGIALPLKELEYDDHVDYAADVSVMESLGGPSLLVERARHEHAANTGADRASFEDLDKRDPELAELVAVHGEGFVPDAGMTREETAFRDPYKFYEHAVCALLRDNEPEKVRLLGKLMAKYRGRERHLINKLSARYNKDKQDGAGNAGVGEGQAGDAGDGGIIGRSKSSENTNLGNKPSTSGMEKIHEGGEDEEQGSSVLNDPSRANIEAIEAAKKKLESAKEGENAAAAAGKPPLDEDGWPPSMADAWGTGGQAPVEGGANGDANPVNDENGENAPRAVDDEGSYSDGSSYSGDESDGVDGTSPAIIAQVSELLNYVYGKTSVAGQIDRVSTIMRAYEGREAVLLELLETKALIKANADSNRDAGDLPPSLRNSPGLNNAAAAGDGKGQAGGNNKENSTNASDKKLTPQTPVSVLTAPTMAEYPGGAGGPASPASAVSAQLSPSAGTLDTANTTSSKKKKKGIFGGFFGSKKKDKVKGGTFPSQNASPGKAAKPSKKMSGGGGKKGAQPLNNEDDRSI